MKRAIVRIIAGVVSAAAIAALTLSGIPAFAQATKAVAQEEKH